MTYDWLIVSTEVCASALLHARHARAPAPQQPAQRPSRGFLLLERYERLLGPPARSHVTRTTNAGRKPVRRDSCGALALRLLPTYAVGQSILPAMRAPRGGAHAADLDSAPGRVAYDVLCLSVLFSSQRISAAQHSNNGPVGSLAQLLDARACMHAGALAGRARGQHAIRAAARHASDCTIKNANAMMRPGQARRLAASARRRARAHLAERCSTAQSRSRKACFVPLRPARQARLRSYRAVDPHVSQGRICQLAIAVI